MELRTAILVDGSFFIKRVYHFHRRFFKSQPNLTADQLLEVLQRLQSRHLSSRGTHKNEHYHYRTFYYDAEPLTLAIHEPVPRKGHAANSMRNFAKEEGNICRLEFLEKLKKMRKVALRLGSIKHHKEWNLKKAIRTELVKGNFNPKDLEPHHFYLESQQKGVDIKLGVDIASLAYEKLVDQIILIAGDSDFVPAAKLARTRGIDFVLDSMRNNIDPSLNEHIDGLTTYDTVSILRDVLKTDPDVTPEWWGEEDRKPRKAKKR